MAITFLHQWKNQGGGLRALPHLTTKNISFLRTCQLLRKMGLKNYAFPLTLYDPDLRDVDVHGLEEDTAENIQLRIKVQIEARKNTWYFLRECIRIYEQGGNPVPFRLDRGSCAMTWCWLNGLDYTSMQPRQSGKAQSLDSLIKTPSGWVRNGDLKINQILTMPDGTQAPVIGIYPQGFKDMYRVTFEDGRWGDSCDEHLWKVYHSHWEPENTRWRVVELKDIINHQKMHPNSESGFSIPLIEPELREDVDLPLDPYVVGALLGDGGLTNGARISSQDDFILKEVSKLLPECVELVHDTDYDYRIIDKSRTASGRFSPFLQLIRALGMNKYSYEKAIPDIYLTASTSQKLSLIQGLMDTDGTVCKKGSSSFCTTSLKMAHQVQTIIRSLGGICKLKERQTYYTYKGEHKAGRKSYILSIRIREPKSLFRLPRKLEKLPENYKSANTLKLRILSVEYIGKHESQCIMVDHPDHLYITEDHVVTHNTVCALSLIANVLYNVGYEFVVGGMAKDSDLRNENVKRVKAFGDNLPSWWMLKDKFKDKTNTEELYYNEYRTHYQTFVAQKEKAAADKQGRGGSMPMVHWDEFEYIANIGTSYPTMISSGSTARENAKKNDKPCSNIITTTAGDPLTQPCKEAAILLEGAMPFTEQLYDVENLEKLHALVAARSPQKMIIGIFSHLQLGYDNAWLRDRIRRGRLTEDQVKRDFLNQRVSIADQPIIPKNILAIITASQKEPSHIQIMSDKFVIYWYLPKDVVESQSFKDRPIVVGCDSSEMIGRDATTLVGIDPRSLETVFTFRCIEGNINVVGMMIAKLMMMFPKMILVPENKSSGTAFIDNISLILRKEGHNPFLRIFNWIVHNKNSEEFAKYNIRDMSLLDSAARKYFGIKTDKGKREELYGSVLLEATTRAASRIKDKVLIQELSSLTVRKGRIDHAVGGNDDTVVAFLMAMWFILNGKNLDMYGIKPGTIMSVINPGQPDKTRLAEVHQAKIRTQLEDLEKALQYQKDPSLRKLIEADITLYRSMVDNGPIPTPVTADELNRDPRRYTDPLIAEQSRTPIHLDDVERGLRMILNV